MPDDSQEKLIAELDHEMRRAGGFQPAARVDEEPVGLLDVLYAYRLFLGRWPERRDPAWLEERRANHSLIDFMLGFLQSPEFQVRVPQLAGVDLVVMRETEEGHRFFFNLKDRQAMRIVTGIHEPYVCRAMRQLVRPGMNCIDAGAHIGLYSIILSSLVGPTGGKVWSFEPFGSTYDLLLKNIAENRMEDFVIAHHAACHATTGPGRVRAAEEGDLGSAYIDPAAAADAQEGEAIRLVRLDDAIPPDVRIGLVKMDIEGSEPFALRGMQRILERDRPILICEFIPGAQGVAPQDYLGALRSARYRLFDISPFILENSRREFVYQGDEETRMLLCIPEEVPPQDVLNQAN